MADITKSSIESMGKQPLARQAASLIKQRIKRGIYTKSAPLPSIRQLSSELGMSHNAIQRAVRQLEGERVLQARHGVGLTVLTETDCHETALFFGFVQPYYSRFSLSLQRYMEDALDSRANLCVIKTSNNDPQRERREIERLIASGMNGLLLWPVEADTNAEFLQGVCDRLPTVFVDRAVPNVRAPAVVLDYFDGGQQVIRHLHSLGHQRILIVCDPIDISSFRDLKQGLRQQAESLGISHNVVFFDFPISWMLETRERGDYSLGDECYEQLAPLLKEGQFDALFCPQNNFFEQVFVESGRLEFLDGIQLATMHEANSGSKSRRYYETGIIEWVNDTTRMFSLALDLLQEMSLTRRERTRTIRVPIFLDSAPVMSGTSKTSSVVSPL